MSFKLPKDLAKFDGPGCGNPSYHLKGSKITYPTLQAALYYVESLPRKRRYDALTSLTFQVYDEFAECDFDTEMAFYLVEHLEFLRNLACHPRVAVGVVDQETMDKDFYYINRQIELSYEEMFAGLSDTESMARR